MADRQQDLSFDIQLPRAGAIIVQAVTVAATIDLTTGAPLVQSSNFTANVSSVGDPSQALSAGGGAPTAMQPSGCIGHYIDVCADGADLGIISGPTLASVSGGNAPVLATTGGPTTPGVCMRIFAGTTKPYYVKPDDRFLGVVASAGTCTVRIALSSR